MSNWERKQSAMVFSTQNAASARQPECNEHVLIVALHLIMSRCYIGIVGQQLVGSCEEDGVGGGWKSALRFKKKGFEFGADSSEKKALKNDSGEVQLESPQSPSFLQPGD